MEKLLKKKQITTLLFLFFIFGYAIINGQKELPVLIDTVGSFDWEKSELSDLIGQIDSAINENAAGRYYFIDAFGYMHAFQSPAA